MFLDFLKAPIFRISFQRPTSFQNGECNSPLESDLLSRLSRLLPQQVISNYLDLLTLSVSVLIQIRKHRQRNYPKVQRLGSAAWKTISQELTQPEGNTAPGNPQRREGGREIGCTRRSLLQFWYFMLQIDRVLDI